MFRVPFDADPRARRLGAALVGGALLASLAHAALVTGPGALAGGSRAPGIDAALLVHADCLWYSARNRGFYLVQREAVASAAATGSEAAGTADRRALWESFLDTVGRSDCGEAPAASTARVLDALSASAREADRHFLGDAR